MDLDYLSTNSRSWQVVNLRAGGRMDQSQGRIHDRGNHHGGHLCTSAVSVLQCRADGAPCFCHQRRRPLLPEHDNIRRDLFQCGRRSSPMDVLGGLRNARLGAQHHDMHLLHHDVEPLFPVSYRLKETAACA